MTTWSPTQIAREREATMQPPHLYSIRKPIGTERERERERERPRGLKESGSDHLATNPKS